MTHILPIETPTAPVPDTKAPPALSSAVRGQPPKVLVQWLQSDEARRRALSEGLPMGASSRVRQAGIEWHHTHYPLAYALAELETEGHHANKLVAKLGFTETARRVAGGWSISAHSILAAGRLMQDDPNPNMGELLGQGREEALQGGQLTEGDLAKRMTYAATIAAEFKAYRDAKVVEDVERAKKSPLYDPAAFLALAQTDEPPTLKERWKWAHAALLVVFLLALCGILYTLL